MVELLAKSGASLDPVDDDVQTPLFRAVSTGRADVAGKLVELGANVQYHGKVCARAGPLFAVCACCDVLFWLCTCAAGRRHAHSRRRCQR
jgi:hypothetical protein